MTKRMQQGSFRYVPKRIFIKGLSESICLTMRSNQVPGIIQWYRTWCSLWHGLLCENIASAMPSGRFTITRQKFGVKTMEAAAVKRMQLGRIRSCEIICPTRTSFHYDDCNPQTMTEHQKLAKDLHSFSPAFPTKFTKRWAVPTIQWFWRKGTQNKMPCHSATAQCSAYKTCQTNIRRLQHALDGTKQQDTAEDFHRTTGTQCQVYSDW